MSTIVDRIPVYQPPKALSDVSSHYCPGCTHGATHRIVAEVMDELGLTDRAVGIASVGCSVLAYNYFECDMQQAAHGRAPAVATGIKRVRPDLVVWTYQGDGDLASIGTNEVIHAALRGEKITIIFINNAIYGMTGGQAAPTTLLGQKTATTPFGRDKSWSGSPIHLSEMLALQEGAAFIARTSTHNPAHLGRTKSAIKRAFQTQLEGKGFSLVEVLSTCPTNWGMTPVEALKWVEEKMVPVYPLGVFKDWQAEGARSAASAGSAAKPAEGGK